MKIQNGSNVEVHYTLHLNGPEGEIVEQTVGGEPMRFVFGDDPMLAKFESTLLGLSAGDKFTVAIPCPEAYGEEEEDFYMEFEKSEFLDEEGQFDDDAFAEGEVVPMQTPEGDMVQGVVAEVKLNSIIIDFNHPLAGENLYFEGEVVSVA
jgi:FKBP-type peptidyl-prolyl cis-trans isomerase SlyD